MIDRDMPFLHRLPIDPPVVITTRFGEPADPIAGGHPHRGVDFGVVVGTPIYAPADGIVKRHTPGDGWGDGSFGNFLILDHVGTPWYSGYAHLSEFTVDNGWLVHLGEPIAKSGNTGLSTGPHLHWQLSTNPWFDALWEHTADPLLYLLEDDMTEAQVKEIISGMQATGALASTSDVLACIAQIVGAEPNTYSDTARIAAVRDAIARL